MTFSGISTRSTGTGATSSSASHIAFAATGNRVASNQGVTNRVTASQSVSNRVQHGSTGDRYQSSHVANRALPNQPVGNRVNLGA